MRHGAHVLAQGVILGAGASRGASGRPHPAPVRHSQADSGDPQQERPSSSPSSSPASSLGSARGSHQVLWYHSCTSNFSPKENFKKPKNLLGSLIVKEKKLKH